MVSFRPHTLTFTTVGTSGGQDDNGFPLPDQSGATVQIPCRFVAGGTKVYKNEDSTEILQKGRIRIDAGLDAPIVGQEVTVTMGEDTLFKGPIMEAYKGGQLGSWRFDV